MKELKELRENQLKLMKEKMQEIESKTSFDLSYFYLSEDMQEVFREVADNFVDIYYSQLDKYNNQEYIERAIKEGFIDIENYDFYKHKQAAEYLENLDTIYSEEEEVIQYLLIDKHYDLLKDNKEALFDSEELKELLNGTFNIDDYDHEINILLFDEYMELIKNV